MSLDLIPEGPVRDLILASARRAGITIYGAGGFARAVARCLSALDIEVAAFVVKSPQLSSVDGIPVISLDQVDARLRLLPMWIGVFNREPQSDLGAIAQSVRQAIGVEPLLPQHYFELLAETMGWRFWLSNRDAYLANADSIKRVFSLLDDERSRRAFASTIAFRLGKVEASAPAPCDGPQYLPDFVLAGLSPGLSFIDGGAFDGDSLAEVSQHLALGHAYAFEPDPKNFRALVQRCSAMSFPVTCFPCGLAATTGNVTCALGEGESSSIKHAGSDVIQVVRLDDCLPNADIAFLKLDIEGYEVQALRGARNLISRCRPVLAIAGYHLCDDLWTIPNTLLDIDSSYRIAYRMHAHNTFDSVFYAY